MGGKIREGQKSKLNRDRYRSTNKHKGVSSAGGAVGGGRVKLRYMIQEPNVVSKKEIFFCSIIFKFAFLFLALAAKI